MYFVIISPLKKRGPFICTNLNPLYPIMHYAKFGWNWISCSGEDKNVKKLRQQRQRRPQRRRTTAKVWSEKLTCDFGSGELKTTTRRAICSNKLIIIYHVHFSLNVHAFMISDIKGLRYFLYHVTSVWNNNQPWIWCKIDLLCSLDR